MDRQPFAMCLRDHLPAYAHPLAALSRIHAPLFRALPPGHRTEMHRPGHLTLVTNVGEVRVRIDLAAQPALESIALDPVPARRIALANLYLQPWLDTLQPYLADYGVATPWIGDLVPADDRLAVTLGLGMACGLSIGVDSQATGDNAGSGDDSFHCIVEAVAPALVDVFVTRHAQDSPPAETLLSCLEDIPIPTRLRLASRRYKMATLRGLQHGDILLGWPWQYDDSTRAVDGENDPTGTAPGIGGDWLWGTAGQRQCRHPASIEEHCIHIIDRPDMNDDRIDSHHPDAGGTDLDFAAPGTDASDAQYAHDHDGHGSDDDHQHDEIAPDTSLLEGVDLMVHVEIGCVAMTAAELSRVRPGYVLTLPEKISNAQVNLVVSGRTIATGELVAVGDQLGVRVHRNGRAHG